MTFMKILDIDASTWRSEDDFFIAIKRALGAPDWHGHNLNALVDSIVVGDMNEINLPFRLSIHNISKAPEEVARNVASMLAILNQEICDSHSEGGVFLEDAA